MILVCQIKHPLYTILSAERGWEKGFIASRKRDAAAAGAASLPPPLLPPPPPPSHSFSNHEQRGKDS